MKKLIFALLIPFFACCCFAGVLDSKGEKVSFAISENTPIVIPDSADKKLMTTAEELSAYLSQIYDLKLPIAKESEYRGNTCISLGKTEMSQKAYANVYNYLNDDGIGLRLKDNVFYIMGGPSQGVRNSVYCLLEEDLGCRWWDRHAGLWDTENIHTDIPKIHTPVIKFVPRLYNPQFIIRNQTHYDIWGDAFIKANRIHWTDCELGTHSSFSLVSPDNFKDHPEWFSEIEGKRVPDQLCWSNPEVIKLMKKGLTEIMSKSDKDLVGLSPQDGRPPCDCPKCHALAQKYGTSGAAIYLTLNDIAKYMEKDFPNVKIIILAYLHYVEVPKNFRPHKNLLIQVCSDTVEWYKPFATYDEVQKFPRDAKAWAKTGGNIMAWTYVQNLDHYLLPYPNYQQIQKNIRILRDWNFKGIYAQGGFGPRTTLADDEFIKTWVWAKLMWNPNLDYRDLRKEFITNYFKESAEPILEYEKLLDALYDDNHKTFKVGDESTYILGSHPLLPIGRIRYAPNVELYTDEFCQKVLDLTQKALDMAKSDETKRRVMSQRACALYLNIGRNIGWMDEYTTFHPLEYDQSKKKIYQAWLDELIAILDLYDIDTIAETTQPDTMKDNRKVSMDYWKNALAIDSASVSVREVSAPWKFAKDENNSINPLSDEYDTSSWTDMPCNTNWETVIGDYDGYAWYERSEDFSAEDMNRKNIFMYIGAADEEATVYINGRLACEHTCAKLNKTGNDLWNKPFVFDIKPLLKQGRNRICIKAHDDLKAGGVWGKVKFIFTDSDMDEGSLLIIGNK